MLPESLEKIIESTDYIEYDFRIQKVDLSADILKVEFSIVNTAGGSEHTNVIMTIESYLDYLIKKDDHSGYSNS